MTNFHTKLLILGSGPAGLSAAIYGARANLAPLLVHGMQPGGQLTITTDVENYPGFADTIQGPWLMEQMEAQAKKVGVSFQDDHITSVDVNVYPFLCVGDTGHHYTAEALIICTGAQARWLELPSELKYRGYGVSGCATCDAFFFRGHDVVVVGGGNTAAEEALFLTKHARSVTLVHRRNALRAEKMLQDRVLQHPSIRLIWDHAVDEILGTDTPLKVTGVRLRHVRDNSTQEIAATGVFIAIGHTPNTGLFRDQLAMDADGYIRTSPGNTHTSVAGVFAAGDVQDKVYRQAVTAAGTGCMAALDAEKFLAMHR